MTDSDKQADPAAALAGDLSREALRLVRLGGGVSVIHHGEYDCEIIVRPRPNAPPGSEFEIEMTATPVRRRG